MKRLLPSLAMTVLLPWFWVTLAPDAAGKDNQQAVAVQKPAAVAANEYVGSEVCTTCHEDVATKFSSNPHAQLALLHGGKGNTCESCHGPGAAHIAGGGNPTKILRLDKMSAKKLDATCLGCHESVHPNFERSPHGEADVSCISCHSVHKSTSEASLLKVSQPKLCYGCHTDVKPAFAQPFHHRVDEGLMTCSDCHDVHGSFKGKQLRTTADQNAICTKCHVETAGPFVYEHPVVKVEGCTECHSPHGSPNPRLLNVANVNTLCLQCHSSINLTTFPIATAENGGPVHNQATQYVACTNCHTQIHGSNAAYNFFR